MMRGLGAQAVLRGGSSGRVSRLRGARFCSGYANYGFPLLSPERSLGSRGLFPPAPVVWGQRGPGVGRGPPTLRVLGTDC